MRKTGKKMNKNNKLLNTILNAPLCDDHTGYLIKLLKLAAIVDAFSSIAKSM